MDFLKWYKNTVELIDEEPSEFVWENIQNSLDINQVWSNLNRKLSARRKYLIAAAAILTFLVIGGYWFFRPQIESQKSLVLNNNAKPSKKQSLENKNTSKNKALASNITASNPTHTKQKKLSTPTKEKSELDQYGLKKDISIPKNLVETQHENRLKKLHKTRAFFIYFAYPDIVIKTNDSIVIGEKEKNERFAFRKLYLGSTGQLANTWLLNEKTSKGLESTSLITSRASFGYNFGLFIGTNISRQVDLQLDLNILAQNNQNYDEYKDGHFTSNSLKFNYSQIGLSLRYYFISKQFMQGEHGINLGGYLGYLRNASQLLNNEKSSINEYYTKLDYGIYLGYEYIIPLTNKLGLGIGAKGYYGFKNIYAGTEFIPGYLNNTRNASVNLTLSLKYLVR